MKPKPGTSQGKRSFEAPIEAGPRGGAVVAIPFDVEAAWGGRRVPVEATFDGHPYRGSVVFMGGHAVLGVTKAVREAVGKEVGDRVRVEIRPDREPRTVEAPPELAAALAARPELEARFEALAYTHRKEFARWVGEAKKPETRDRRASRAVEMLEARETLS